MTLRCTELTTPHSRNAGLRHNIVFSTERVKYIQPFKPHPHASIQEPCIIIYFKKGSSRHSMVALRDSIIDPNEPEKIQLTYFTLIK